MRLLLMVCLAFCGFVGLASAQESANPAVVESVISAAPEADGMAYLLSVMLKDGRQLSLQVQAADAVKIIDGLSKTAGPGSQKTQIVASPTTTKGGNRDLGRTSARATENVRPGFCVSTTVCPTDVYSLTPAV